jgi:hypothetical protein
MSIVAQPRRRGVTNLRIAIWSAFLLALVVPVLSQRFGHPYYGALLLRPGSWLLATIAPSAANDRVIVLVNFFLYVIVIYGLLRVLAMKKLSGN